MQALAALTAAAADDDGEGWEEGEMEGDDRLC